jgi:curved DNA-binding protein CbpA
VRTFVARVSAYHPDRHAAAIEAEPERGRALVSLQARLNEAYRILSNPRRRADYDRVVAAGELRLVGRTTTRPRCP